MSAPNDKSDLSELISQLNNDRAWLLEQIDKGRWPEIRNDLASFERDLGQFLIRTTESLEE